LTARNQRAKPALKAPGGASKETVMPKKLLFQERRVDPLKRPPPTRHHFVLEPVDFILVAVIILLTLWVNWLLGILPA
jgi:hypothetical protein